MFRIKKLFCTKNHFLLCVGDPKQAIYKFRGGDIETYLEAKSDAIEVFSLTNNFRSSNKLPVSYTHLTLPTNREV